MAKNEPKKENLMDPVKFLPDLLNYIQSRRSVIYGVSGGINEKK